MAQLPREWWVPIPRGVQNHRDVALRDMVSEHGGGGGSAGVGVGDLSGLF